MGGTGGKKNRVNNSTGSYGGRTGGPEKKKPDPGSKKEVFLRDI